MPRLRKRSRQPFSQNNRTMGIFSSKIEREKSQTKRGLQTANLQRRSQRHRILARPRREPAPKRRIRPRFG